MLERARYVGAGCRERASALSDDRRVSLGETADHSVDSGQLRRLAHAPVRRARIAKSDVVGDRATKQRRILRYPGDLLVPGGRVAGGEVGVTDEDPTGGVGITQAVNGVSLPSVTTTENATAYSLGQQLIVTAWNCVFAIAMVIWVFGWTGGKQLVGQSYTGAKEKAAEQSAAHKARKAGKKAAKQSGGGEEPAI